MANINEFLVQPAGGDIVALTVDALRERILERIFGTRDRARIPTLALTDADWSSAHELLERRYGNWGWNFGENPPSNVQRVQRFPGGEIDVRLDVHAGRISAVRFFGDFMGRVEVSELESRLAGLAYHRDTLAATLGVVDVRGYFGDISAAEVLGLLAP
ncbi:MAG: hypothetical protein JJD97_03895 [Gemmatimonadaceae bacterium]|nr:hypothetical protein [Gemmatimonadaceae bacterium]